jgi:hypothetical protein
MGSKGAIAQNRSFFILNPILTNLYYIYILTSTKRTWQCNLIIGSHFCKNKGVKGAKNGTFANNALCQKL